MASDKEAFSGSSAYSATIEFVLTGSGEGDWELFAEKESGSGYWTATGQDYYVNFNGSRLKTGTWTYDFRDYSKKVIAKGTWSGGSGSVAFSAYVEMASGIGTSTPAGTITVTTVPGKVGAPSLEVNSSGNIFVDWAAPSSGGSAITRYEVQFSLSSSYTAPTTLNAGTATSDTITDPVPDKTHYVRVRAVNAVGAGSWSNTASIKVPDVPGKVNPPTLTYVLADQIEVNWTAPTTDVGTTILEYQVQYSTSSSFSSATTVGTTLRTETIGPLTRGVIWYVRVRARNQMGWGAWSLAPYLRTPTTPATPGSPTVTQVAQRSFRFGWTAPDNGGLPIGSYQVAVQEVGGATTNYPVASGTLFKVVPAAPNRTYRVTVEALNSLGDSAPTTVQEVQTPPLALVSRGGVWVPVEQIDLDDDGAWSPAVSVQVSRAGVWVLPAGV